MKAVIDFFGPTDLIAMYRNAQHPMVPFLVQSILGTTPDENPDWFRQASPLYQVTKNSPPTLIFHGGRDGLVQIAQSRALQQKLEDAGVPHRLHTYPTEGHGWYGRTLTHSFDLVEEFLEEHVK